MAETVKVRKRGVLTLPADLRQKYKIKEGDIFGLLDLDGMFVLTPKVLMVAELAREIEAMRLEQGLNIQELLEGLRAQRDRTFQEQDTGVDGD